MADVRVGDYVYDENGNPVQVIWKSPKLHNRMYRVTMVDGESIVVGEGHLWNVATDSNRQSYTRAHPAFKAARRATRASRAKAVVAPGKERVAMVTAERNRIRAELARATEVVPNIWDYTRTVSTKELFDLVSTEKKRVGIPVHGAITGGTPWTWEVDPYVFGVWLGDGGRSNGYIAQADEDADDLIRCIQSGNWNVRRVSDGHIVYALNHKVTGKSLYTTLKAAYPDLRHGKYIPNDVFTSDYQSRLAVLQGLVDTDGHINDRGQLEMCLTDERLIKDVQHLMATLGMRVGITQCEAAYKKDGVRIVTGIRYTIKCTPNIAVARYPRKLNKLSLQHNRSDMRNAYRYIDSVEPVEIDPEGYSQCIQVASPRGLFLWGNSLLVTHNSDYMLMAALQYVDVPGYSALIMRRSWPDLNSPGAILERFTNWMAPHVNSKEVHRGDQGRLWTFPSGAKIQFSYAARPADKYKFQGAEYQFVGFDEATQFEPEIYEYLLSRIRKPVISCAICTQPLNRYILKGKVAFRHSKGQKGACSSPLPDPGAMSQYTPAPDGTTIFDVPLRMRLTANPGGLSHMYFKERFIDGTMRDGDGKQLDAAFIPSALKDNPSLNQAEYQQQLANLSPVDRERLLNGNWEIMDEGAWFHRGMFDYIDAPPADKDVIGRCRFWDFAATDNKTSDYTAGALCSITTDGRWVIEDIKRFKKLPAEVEREVKKTAIEDGINIPVYSEMELGSSGKALASHYTRNVLPGFQYKAIRVTGKKEARAGALASQAAEHNVYIVKGDWNIDFVNEITTFPTGLHDDQVDAVAHAFIQLAQLSGKRRVRVVV